MSKHLSLLALRGTYCVFNHEFNIELSLPYSWTRRSAPAEKQISYHQYVLCRAQPKNIQWQRKVRISWSLTFLCVTFDFYMIGKLSEEVVRITWCIRLSDAPLIYIVFFKRQLRWSCFDAFLVASKGVWSGVLVGNVVFRPNPPFCNMCQLATKDVIKWNLDNWLSFSYFFESTFVTYNLADLNLCIESKYKKPIICNPQREHRRVDITNLQKKSRALSSSR